MNLDNYSIKDATHVLWCRHQSGNHFQDYTMPCIVLGETLKRKLKIIVFGERWWKNKEHKKRIRYVPKYRVNPLREAAE